MFSINDGPPTPSTMSATKPPTATTVNQVSDPTVAVGAPDGAGNQTFYFMDIAIDNNPAPTPSVSALALYKSTNNGQSFGNPFSFPITCGTPADPCTLPDQPQMARRHAQSSGRAPWRRRSDLCRVRNSKRGGSWRGHRVFERWRRNLAGGAPRSYDHGQDGGRIPEASRWSQRVRPRGNRKRLWRWRLSAERLQVLVVHEQLAAGCRISRLGRSFSRDYSHGGPG